MDPVSILYLALGVAIVVVGVVVYKVTTRPGPPGRAEPPREDTPAPAREDPAPPVRPAAARPAQRGVERVAGTTWAGTDSQGDYYEYHFMPDGSLHYKSPTGFWKNGTWKQDGDQIYMETNNKYCERFGTIRGTTMKGHAKNVAGGAWNWSATKQ